MGESLNATLFHGIPLKQRWLGMVFTKYGVSEGLLLPSLNLSYMFGDIISINEEIPLFSNIHLSSYSYNG